MIKAGLIEMDQHAARKAYAEYRGAIRRRHNEEWEQSAAMYRELMRGRRLVNIYQAIQAGGFDHKFRPRLGIARADHRLCLFRFANQWGPNNQRLVFYGGNAAYASGGINERQNSRDIIRVTITQMPQPDKPWIEKVSRALVPNIPPRFMPAGDLSKYHILWEPDWEMMPPVDPILLRQIQGPIFAVIAQWDLTEVERAVLAMRT